MKVKELEPIVETSEDSELLEAKLVRLFKEEIYFPLLAEIGVRPGALKNNLEDLVEAIKSNRIYFDRGSFKGKFNATISRELKKLGAVWDRKESAFKIPLSKLKTDVRTAVALSDTAFSKAVGRIDEKLSSLVPEEIAGRFKAEQIFDSRLWKMEKTVRATLKNITVPAQMTDARRQAIAEEYTQNMRLYIKDWTEKEIVALRKKIQESTFKGIRYEEMIKTIQKSYEVSFNKAKFLARQETGILMAKFKASRYEEAGINEYKWRCVAGSTAHPVRPMHKALGDRSNKGETFRFDDPPVVNDKGERKNPGEDYGCRCTAVPVVRF